MNALAHLRMLQCADTAFPSGGFAFSSGLESLGDDGHVTRAEDVQRILETQILDRWLEFDRVFHHRACAAADDPARLLDIDHQCHLQSGADRLAEASRRVGRSLLTVHAKMQTPCVVPYRTALFEAGRADSAGYEPVVQGVIGFGLGLNPPETEAGALHSVIMNFLSAAVRLGQLGAIEAQVLLARVLPGLAEALKAPVPERAGAFSPLAEIAALRRSDERASLFAT